MKHNSEKRKKKSQCLVRFTYGCLWITSPTILKKQIQRLNL